MQVHKQFQRMIAAESRVVSILRVLNDLLKFVFFLLLSQTEIVSQSRLISPWAALGNWPYLRFELLRYPNAQKMVLWSQRNPFISLV